MNTQISEMMVRGTVDSIFISNIIEGTTDMDNALIINEQRGK